MAVVCEQCDPPREFANAGALRFHAIAKHGADAGHCDICNEDFDRLSAHKKRSHKVEAGVGDFIHSGPGAAVDPGPNTDESDDMERPPNVADYIDADDLPPPASSGRVKLSDRIRSKVWGKGDSAQPAPPSGGSDGLYGPSREKAPRHRLLGKRATTAPIMALAWGGVGAGLERSQADVPVGRVLQFQAPAAGEILDRLIAKTWVDRVLQPFAQKTDDIEALGALLALPVLVGMVERSPAMAATLEPMLRQVVAANVLSMAPVVKQKKADAKKLRDVIAELDPEMAAAGVDPVETILAAIFAPAPQPSPEGAGTNGRDQSGAVV